jgi:6-phosphogluconolactonase
MPARNLEIIPCRDATELAATAAAQWLALLASRASGIRSSSDHTPSEPSGAPLTPSLSPRSAKGEGDEGKTPAPFLSLHPMRGEGARRAGEGCSDGNAPFTVALSGGRITEAFFREVVRQSGASSTAFAKVHFFWADERCVPPTDTQSNFKLADELLLQPLGIPMERIHRLRGEDEPLTAAHAAEAELRTACRDAQDGQPVLDLVFLGMGEDGHVASLFPREPEAMTRDAAVYRAVFNSPKPPPTRLTLGYRALAAAREVWVLASGKGKEAALLASLEDGGRTPLGRVIGMRQRTRVFMDIDLSGRLRE